MYTTSVRASIRPRARAAAVVQRRLAIAMFTDTFAPVANGVATSVNTARDALRARGHHVQVFTAGRCPPWPATDVHYYGGKALNGYPDFHLALYPRLQRPSTVQRVRRGEVDLVHLHGPGPMGMRGHGVARRLDLPYVYTYHTLLKPLAGYASPGLRPILSALAHRNQARMASKAARFILPSHYLYREVTEQDPHLAPRCSVVPTGVHVDRFRPDLDGAAARAAWGVPDDAEVLLYLGRLGFEKRIHVLIDAFERLHERRPNARLVLSGKGPGMDDFRRHAKPLGDAVHFTGFVPDEQLPAHYAAADAFASASDFETQGLTLLEAMATGRPCAVARAGGYLDVIEEDRNCYAFTPGDVDDAADAMERALDAPAALRRAARDTALAYSKDRMMDLLERTYFEAVGRA